MQTLILGVGNLLLTDEGVGVHVIQALEKEELPEGVDLMDGGTGGFHLVGRLQEYDKIIMIDATLDASPPGTIRLLHPRFVNDFPPLMSAHEIGLRDMIEVMILTGKLPEIDLIVVSVENISEVRIGLSPKVAEAIPAVMRLIRKQLEDALECVK